jgi:phospholipid/cholesterol/gamma-HCH transport system ATP-binding protein
MTTTPAIEMRHVSLAFDEKPVIDDVSFQVPAGGTLILLGATGSGKSVLLKLILGLLKPDRGEILIEGQDIVPLPETALNSIRKRMGIVFQEGALFDSLSVYENVSYRLREDGERDEAKIEARVREVLGFVEMEHAIDKMPAELSGGMRRRVAIARAIASAPSIMLYDSPTAGLDPITAQTINVLIIKLRDLQGVTSVVVTHRLQDTVVLTNFVYSAERKALVPASTDGGPRRRGPVLFQIMREGRVAFQGTQEELARAADPSLQRFVA